MVPCSHLNFFPLPPPGLCYRSFFLLYDYKLVLITLLLAPISPIQISTLRKMYVLKIYRRVYG